ncbi:hypothetical protein [Granulicella sp. L60]|uniref:hypothetical protein n=1 Tax=Granulicella sp. L60 TaxID=1641866 RepID=UPI00131DE4F4|nr:hypothetical protein [Granulicella sp. L60]
MNYQQHLRGELISNVTTGNQSYVKRIAALKFELLSPDSLASSNALEAAKYYDNPDSTRFVMEDLHPECSVV